MICKKCKTPLKSVGSYALGMFLDWWECPKCDLEPEEKEMNDISEEMKKAGFVFREPDKGHPSYEFSKKLCEYLIDDDSFECVHVEEEN